MSKFLIEREAAENDLLACAAFLGERVGSLDGHAEAVSKVARIYAEKNEVDLAASLVDTINDPHARDANLVEIAAKCAAIDDDEYAFQLAEAIEEFGLQEQAKTLIAINQARRGRFDDALQTVEMLGDPSSAFGEIALSLAQKDEAERAREVFERIDFPLVRVQVLNEIAALATKGGELEKAAGFLEESLAETAEIEFPGEKVQILLDTANKFFNVGNLEQTTAILQEASDIAESLDDRFRDQYLTQISLAFAKFGDFAAAERIREKIRDLHQIALCLSGFALEYETAGEREKAIENLEEAWQTLKSQPESKVRSSEARFGLWATIAIRFAQFGKEERALEIAQANPEEGNYHAALTSIAAICAAHEKADATKSALAGISDFSNKTFALIGISDAEAKRENTPESLQALTEAHQVAENITQFSMQSRALDEIAVRFAERNEKDKASKVLFESLQTVQKILDQAQQSVSLADLAIAYEKAEMEIGDKEREVLRSIVRKLLTT